MAESPAGERTEQATPKRLKEAREKGQVARSRELTTALLLMTASLTLYAFSSSSGKGIAQVAKSAFSPDRRNIFQANQMLQALYELISGVLVSVAPIFLLLYAVTFLSTMLTGGMTFSTKAMAPKLDRMSPLKGVKRMFGMHALMELVKALAKVFVVFLVGFLVIRHVFPELTQLGNGDVYSSIGQAMDLVARSFFLISLSLLVIALIDVPYQIWNHAKQLKMTKQEVKDEFKETEGKPEVKSKVRQMQYEMAHRRMMEAVPDADVVVTNPEHYSVAIKYDAMRSSAPIVVAKGVDVIAMQIRKVAIANDVPLLAAPPLARAIFHTTELDQEIPHGLYMAVAQVLAYVFQLNSYYQGKGAKPKTPRNLPIPEELKH
ncbi:flagellar biosynthesis protein FlhB [Aliikangiella sp. G2MR2-5]|uniref:flagellar biosynthesis protein FlhB n=1 Tax=Aliikangiella sp. G2MR2-5 TaxID=2788943 RepID=UPI0018A8F584|nr:flagellar biosynthesis protein FlhB [Aliikangiella sp. G2MR2-5]